jgi:hypothetical protein
MMSRHASKAISAVIFCRTAWTAVSTTAQYGYGGAAGYSLGSQYRLGYGSNPFSVAGYGTVGGYGISLYGYGIGNGRVGRGYQAAAGLYGGAFQLGRAQKVTNYQPLINTITSLPGWNAPVHRARRRMYSRSSVPRVPLIDDSGKIVWPSTVAHEPETAELRHTTEAAVTAVVSESKSAGHASVRPVIDAKKKMWAFKRKVLPAVQAKDATDGAALEGFFNELDHALDVLPFTF